MRIKTSEPLDAVDGVRSVIQLGDETYWVDNPAPIPAAVLVQELLRQARETGLAAIAQAAEARRSTLTAPSPGKLQAYLLKFELVLRANGTPPDEAAKTRLTAEATARGIAYDEHITNISTKRFAQEDAWMRIETVEAASKAAVAAAGDRAAVDAAVATARKLLAEIGG